MSTTQIIMISYFRSHDFEKSISSVLNNTPEPFCLSVIDNSHGGIDTILNKYEQHPNINIYRNSENLGKGKGVMRWYNHIMEQHSTNDDYFISIDADIEVPQNWLTRLTEARKKITTPFAIIAPVIMNEPGNWFVTQLKTGFIMHNPKICYHVIDEIYYNRYTAGPLLLIDKEFFNSVGGYSQNQLYGSDDGKLCKAAADQDRFIGIATNVHVTHLHQDNTIEYQMWKVRHINMDGDRKGFWD